METNELKKIWSALADNNLIDKEIARENIREIITKKGKGIVSKIRGKVIFDYYMYLIASVLIPIVVTIVNLVMKQVFPPLQILGVVGVEVYLVYMFLKSKRKLGSLECSDYLGTIKGSLEEFKDRYLNRLNSERVVAMIFGYFIITVALIQNFIYQGGFNRPDFSKFNTYVTIFLVIMLILLPFVLKLEYRFRFASTIKELENTLEELNSEL